MNPERKGKKETRKLYHLVLFSLPLSFSLPAFSAEHFEENEEKRTYSTTIRAITNDWDRGISFKKQKQLIALRKTLLSVLARLIQPVTGRSNISTMWLWVSAVRWREKRIAERERECVCVMGIHNTRFVRVRDGNTQYTITQAIQSFTEWTSVSSKPPPQSFYSILFHNINNTNKPINQRVCLSTLVHSPFSPFPLSLVKVAWKHSHFFLLCIFPD
jgi:hypothetical protein